MSKINFLIWNVENKKTNEFIEFVKEYLSDKKPDIIVFIEYTNDKLSAYLTDYDEIKYDPNSSKRYSRILIRKSSKIIYSTPTILFGNKVLFTKLELGTKTFNLGAVHLMSQYGGKSPSEQVREMKSLSADIVEFETDIAKNGNTILVGDFNSRPYEQLLNHSDTIIALNSKLLVKQFLKSPCPEKSLLFYNPMWNFMGDYNFGDKKEKPPGSIFYNTGFDPEKVHWSLIDGFLLRPTLMDCIQYESVRIINKYKNHDLVDHDLLDKKNTIINRDIYPDHLPIEFTIDLKNI